MEGKLILETGEIFTGIVFGYPTNVSSEIVFNTSMVGYPESMTDPSYKRQILVLTYPCIGNYGIPNKTKDSNGILEHFESDTIQVSGLIISDYCSEYSHWRASKSLSCWMKESNIPGLYGIDTRQLTKIIREKGTMIGKIICNGDIPFVKPISYNLVKEVSRTQETIYNKGKKYTIIIIDCGIKNNIIRKLLTYSDFTLKIVPYDYSVKQGECDGLFISNGPGDPQLCKETIDNIKRVMQFDTIIPIFGICLGNQLLGLANGFLGRSMIISLAAAPDGIIGNTLSCFTTSA